MPNTFQALAVLLVALLPGALYVWSFERQAGRWGIGLSDRVLRFVGGSGFPRRVRACELLVLVNSVANDPRRWRDFVVVVASHPRLRNGSDHRWHSDRQSYPEGRRMGTVVHRS